MKLFISEEHCIVFVTKGGFMSEGTYWKIFTSPQKYSKSLS